MAAARLEVARDVSLDQGFLGRLYRKVTAPIRRAIDKVLGLLDLRDWTIYLDQTVHKNKEPFLCLHETGHEFLPGSGTRCCEHGQQTFDPEVQDHFEREANVFAREVLFQLGRFEEEVRDCPFGLRTPLDLAKRGTGSSCSTRPFAAMLLPTAEPRSWSWSLPSTRSGRVTPPRSCAWFSRRPLPPGSATPPGPRRIALGLPPLRPAPRASLHAAEPVPGPEPGPRRRVLRGGGLQLLVSALHTGLPRVRTPGAIGDIGPGHRPRGRRQPPAANGERPQPDGIGRGRGGRAADNLPGPAKQRATRGLVPRACPLATLPPTSWLAPGLNSPVWWRLPRFAGRPARAPRRKPPTLRRRLHADWPAPAGS